MLRKFSRAGEVFKSEPRSQRPATVLKPGINCLEIAEARRASVLIDGAAYFLHLEAALRAASRTIFILGWDFDGRIRLRPDLDDAHASQLGPLLRELVEKNPNLQVNILIWSVSVVHGPSAIVPSLLGAEWQDHARINMKLDTQHPVYGAHHQKIICIDGKIAFVGGIDLTVQRWDTPDHRADNPKRIDIDGSPYPPVHDIQILVDGPAAVRLCQLGHERWRAATGSTGEIEDATGPEDPWPEDLDPDFLDVRVAIARTIPAYGGRKEVAEIGALTVDMIASARKAIYIETQYMTASSVGDELARRLQEAQGPDIVIVMTLESRGLIERLAMANNRDRLIRRLVRADRFKRLRVLYPVVPDGTDEKQVLVHAKLLSIDDEMIRVGSANLNNRSIGLDTECDLAIEAETDGQRQAIAAVRNRLIAEHLGCSPMDVANGLSGGGRLVDVVDRLNVGARGLRPFAALTGRGPARPNLATRFLDPIRPFRLLSLLR